MSFPVLEVQLPSPLARHVWDGGSTCLGNIPLRERRSQTPLSAQPNTSRCSLCTVLGDVKAVVDVGFSQRS